MISQPATEIDATNSLPCSECTELSDELQQCEDCEKNACEACVGSDRWSHDQMHCAECALVLIADDLEAAYEASDQPEYLALVVQGENGANGRVRQTRLGWVYVDDCDGYSLMTDTDVDLLTLDSDGSSSPSLTYGEVYGPGGEADDSGYGQDY